MQSKSHEPVGDKVSQDALRGWRTAPEVCQQCNDGVLRRVTAAVPGVGLQLDVGFRRSPSVEKRLVEEEQVSAYPEGHGGGRGHEPS